MNESETRAEYIDPKLKASGWGEVEGSKVLREFRITDGRIQTGGTRSKPEIADYILVYKNQKIGVIEAKAENLPASVGVAQAKAYAEKLHIDYTYATNGKEIYAISMKTGEEGEIADFPTPDELWNKTFPSASSGTTASSGQVAKWTEWKEKFASIPNEGEYGKRYYQEIAINNVLKAIAEEKNRILLTMATGTGKTTIAFQIAWKLFQTRWNLSSAGSDTKYIARGPRILFLADRNILADQAFNAFSAFDKDALVRINPLDIRKKGGVPMSGSVYFTIFQTFMSSAGSDTKFSEEITDFKKIPFTEQNKAGYMYILQCDEGSFYVGSTNDLLRRIEQHKNSKGAKFTKAHDHVKLIYYESFDRVADAFKREKQIQGWSKAKKIALINRDIEKLKKLSENKQDGKVGEGFFKEVPQKI